MRRSVCGVSPLVLAMTMAVQPALAQAEVPRQHPEAYPRLATVDVRFQSYNVEMAQVIGGRFWAPYAPAGAASSGNSSDALKTMFVDRAPIELSGNRRLRNLARALGPAYMRVSGTWANSAYFQDDDRPQLASPPKGFQGVLTRSQWAGVVAFAKAANARLMISFPVSDGARDATGLWSPAEARKLLGYTRKIGGRIYAAELANEPNLTAGLPTNYDGARFAKDVAAFRDFASREAPEMKIVGPGSAGETGAQLLSRVTTKELLSGEPRPRFEIFSYHFYGNRSERCARMLNGAPLDPAEALGDAWLARTETSFAYYKDLRDSFTPGAPIWLTETAQASCGGDRWASTFADTFRYVDQLGRLARQGVSAVFHNTLSEADYALIDDKSQPRPSYWAALLWHKVMGRVVLDAGQTTAGVHLYSHCLPGKRGGVGLAAINLDREAEVPLNLPFAARRYSLTAEKLDAASVSLNGESLALVGDRLPVLRPKAERAGRTILPAASITFFELPTAGNPACK